MRCYQIGFTNLTQIITQPFAEGEIGVALALLKPFHYSIYISNVKGTMSIDIGFHKTDSSSFCIGLRTPMTTRFKYFKNGYQLSVISD